MSDRVTIPWFRSARWGLPPEIRRAFHNAGVRELFAWQIDCLETTGLLAGRNAVISASTR